MVVKAVFIYIDMNGSCLIYFRSVGDIAF